MKKYYKLIISLVILLVVILAVPNHYFSDGLSNTDFSSTTTDANTSEIAEMKTLEHVSAKEISSSSWHSAKTNPIFMEKGTHKFQVTYSSAYDHNYYEIYSDSDMNKNGGKGIVYQKVKLPSTKDAQGDVQTENVAVDCHLSQDVTNLQIRVVYQNDMNLSNVFIYADHDLDKLWYFLFLAIILIVIYYLTNVRYNGVENKNARRIVWILAVLTIYLSLPFMNNFLIRGDDTFFHLARVSGMYESLRDGHFPIFINPKQANLYGYATPVMYPQLFLFIPALLRLFGMSLMGAYKLFLYLINIAGICIAYYSFKHVFSSRRLGVVSCAAYMLSMYFINNQFQRNALGETIAMIFAPLLFLSLFEIYLRDEHKWPLLVIAITGILESHVISVFMYGLIALVIFLILIPYMSKHHFLKRFLALVKAGVVTLLLNAFFLIPFLKYYKEPLIVNVSQGEVDISTFLNYASYISQLFISKMVNLQAGNGSIGLGSTSSEMPITVGFLSLIALVGFVIIYVMKKESLSEKASSRKVLKLGLISAVFSVLLLYMSTDLFPWKVMAFIPVVKNFISMQFPWRILAPATLFIAFIEGCDVALLCELAREKTSALKLTTIRHDLISKVICGMAIVLIGWNSFYYLQNIPNRETYPTKVEVNAQTQTDDFYFYVGSSLSSIAERGDCVTASVEGVKFSHCQRKGTTITFDYQLPKNVNKATLTLPLEAYPTYQANVNGKVMSTHYDAQRFVQVDVEGHTGHVSVYFKAPTSFMIAYAISGCTLLLCIVAWIVYNKKISRM